MAVLIRGGQVLMGTPAALRRADVLVESDRIAALGPALTAPAGARVIEAADRIVLPGMGNAHTHAASHLARGRVGTFTLEDLLTYSPANSGFRTPDDEYLSAPAVADVVFYQTVPGLSDLLPPDLRHTVQDIQPAPTKGLLDLTERAIRRWHGSAEGRVHVAVAPTIPNQATDELLDGCAALAREYGVGIHTHLAESKVQVVESRRRWGKSIVARLADHRVLGPGFVGAHSVWLDDDDLRMLADAGAAVAHNPGSNLRLGVGIAPVREMLDRGLAVGLGTDGSTCADNQNLFEALRIASVISTIRFPHETARWLDADTVWGLATSGTARVMGQPGDLGALAPGRKADLVLLRTDSIFLRPLADPVKALVYAETGASVDTVLVDGRVVLDQGHVTTVDETRIYARAQEAADRHRERAADAWALAGRLAPYVAAACRGAVTTPLPINRFAAPTPTS